MKISAITITKNEASNIENSINSYKDVVDEIIIVDTGSTDNTKEICTNLGCKVIDYEWENDFSKARNFAIEQTTCDTILFLDSDEFFEYKLDNNFRTTVEDVLNRGYNGIKFLTKNIDESSRTIINNSYGLKLFKNLGFRYDRKIHEVLKDCDEKLNTVTVLGYDLIHTGYKKDVDLDKCKRNLDILNKSYENKEYDTIDLFYLSRENLAMSNYELADEFCDKFLESDDLQDILATSDIAYLSYFYKYYIMQKLNYYSDSDLKNQLLKIESLYPNIPQTYYELAIFEKSSDLNKAIEYFRKCIKLNLEFENEHKLTNNFGNYEPNIYHTMAEIEFILDKRDEALSHCIVSCMLDRHNSDFLGLLLKLVKNKDTMKIIDTLNKVYQPKTTSDYEFLIDSLVNTQLYGVFIEYTMKYNIEHNGGSNLVFFAMILNTQTDLCIETVLDIYEKKGNEYNLFIASLAIMYNNDIDLYYAYRNRLSIIYKNALDYYFGKTTDISEDDYSVFINLYDRLIYLTKKINYIQDIDMEKISQKQLMKILNTLESIGKFREVYLLSNKLIYNDRFIDVRDELISMMLFSLFMTRKYTLFIKWHNKLVLAEHITIDKYSNLLKIATKDV